MPRSTIISSSKIDYYGDMHLPAVTKAKEGSLQASQATKEEERKQREAVAKLKAQQRAEVGK